MPRLTRGGAGGLAAGLRWCCFGHGGPHCVSGGRAPVATVVGVVGAPASSHDPRRTARPLPRRRPVSGASAGGGSSSISKVCGSSAPPGEPEPAHDPLAPHPLRRRPPPGCGTGGPAAPGGRPTASRSSSWPDRRSAGPRPRCRRPSATSQGLGQVALGRLALGGPSGRPASSCSPALSASAAAPASSRPLAGSSSPEVASSIAASARRTSWASSVARAPSTRWCSRSSRAAENDRYQASSEQHDQDDRRAPRAGRGRALRRGSPRDDGLVDVRIWPATTASRSAAPRRSRAPGQLGPARRVVRAGRPAAPRGPRRRRPGTARRSAPSSSTRRNAGEVAGQHRRPGAHRLDQHDAEALAAGVRRDVDVDRRAAATALSSSLTWPRKVHAAPPARRQVRARLLDVAAARRPAAGARAAAASTAGSAVEQHRQALARLVDPADEGDRGRLRGALPVRPAAAPANRSTYTPLGIDDRVAADVVGDRAPGVLRHRDPGR